MLIIMKHTFDDFGIFIELCENKKVRMSERAKYKSLKKLADSLATGVKRLEKGKLSGGDLEDLLNDARSLHERIAVLQYLQFEKEVKKEEAKEPEPVEEKGTLMLNFEFGEIGKDEDVEVEEVTEEVLQDEDEDEDGISPNQTNLLDAIEGQYEEVADESINDKFSQEEGMTLAEKLSKQPISDLNSAIGINQRFLFTNDLFGGDGDAFNAALESLNSQDDIDSVQEILKGFEGQYSWDMEHKSVIKFTDIVERRYM